MDNGKVSPIHKAIIDEAIGYIEASARTNINSMSSRAEGLRMLECAAEKLKGISEEGVACNPHPKAPHGFARNASHSMDRYVCDCEGWDPYEAGYEAGLQKAFSMEEGDEASSEEEKFCDANCTWLNHHPQCKIGCGYRGLEKQNKKLKERLEVDDRHRIDGITARDATIEIQDEVIERLEKRSVALSDLRLILNALKRGRPQIVGVLVQQDQDEAIATLEKTIKSIEENE